MTDLNYMDRWDDETWRKVMSMKAFPSVHVAILERDFERADRLVNDAVKRWNDEFSNQQT